ncbi:MAG: hypothetical protein AAB358_02765 [Patescibacteria group bacterium]
MNETPGKELTDRQLKFSYWYVSHKIVLRRWLAGFLIAISAGMFFYVIWQLVFYFIGFRQDREWLARILTSDQNIGADLENLKPQPIQISNPEIFKGAGERDDFLVSVINPNKDWLATFDYQFADPAAGGLIAKGFILPGEEKYLFGSAQSDAGVAFQISNQKWQKIKNYETLYNNHFRFSITDDEFTPAVSPSEPSRLSFKLANNSAYNYWEVGVLALLMNGGNIETANQIVLNDFKSGETRDVEINWNMNLPRINSFEVIPEVNFLDPNNIKKPEGDD